MNCSLPFLTFARASLHSFLHIPVTSCTLDVLHHLLATREDSLEAVLWPFYIYERAPYTTKYMICTIFVHTRSGRPRPECQLRWWTKPSYFVFTAPRNFLGRPFPQSPFFLTCRRSWCRNESDGTVHSLISTELSLFGVLACGLHRTLVVLHCGCL